MIVPYNDETFSVGNQKKRSYNREALVTYHISKRIFFKKMLLLFIKIPNG